MHGRRDDDRRCGLTGREPDAPHRLSGGRQQGTAIVRATATRPRVLPRDELIRAVELALVGEIRDLVRERARVGMTVIIPTDEMAFACSVPVAVGVLHAGAISGERDARGGV
jgi:polar amino acid transport system ATP-binding protein